MVLTRKKLSRLQELKLIMLNNPSTADFIIMAPKGDQALAQINNEIYTFTVPFYGGKSITIKLSDVDEAAFPSKKLTQIGGEFPSWSNDAKKVYWSLGNAFFTYNIARSRTIL